MWCPGGGHFRHRTEGGCGQAVASAGRMARDDARAWAIASTSVARSMTLNAACGPKPCRQSERWRCISADVQIHRCAGKGALMDHNTSVAEKPASLPATKPEPTEAEQAEILALAKRKKARRRAPRFKVHQQEGSNLQMMPAGVHADAAAARVMNAFGITNLDLAERLTDADHQRHPSAVVERAGRRSEPERRAGRGDGDWSQGRS